MNNCVQAFTRTFNNLKSLTAVEIPPIYSKMERNSLSSLEGFNSKAFFLNIASDFLIYI